MQPFSEKRLVQHPKREADGATCVTSGNSIILMEQPGNVIEYAAGQGQKQADIRNKVCNGDAPAQCTFTSKRYERTYTGRLEIFRYTADSTPVKVTRKLSTTQGTSNSIEISAKAGINIKKIVSAEISSKYSHGWTESATFGLDIEETVPAYTTKVFYSQNPVHRHNGDFTVRLGNTTWVLKDVYFDQPDKDRQPNQGSYNIPAPGTPTSA